MEFSLPIPTLNENLGHFSSKWHGFISQFNASRTSKTSLLSHYGAQALKTMQVDNKMSHDEYSRFVAGLEELEHQCLFQIVLCFLRHLFFTLYRNEEKSMKSFYTELCLLSDWCGFEKKVRDGLIKKRLIGSIHDKSAKELLLSNDSLTARDILDIHLIAKEQGIAVTSDLINPFLMEQQRKSHNPGMKSKKNHGLSGLAFSETHEAEMGKISFNSLFRNITPRISDKKRTVADIMTKHDGNAFAPNYNCLVPNDSISNSSVFVNDKISTSSIAYPHWQVNGLGTNFTPHLQPTSSYMFSYQGPQHQQIGSSFVRGTDSTSGHYELEPDIKMSVSVKNDEKDDNSEHSVENSDNLLISMNGLGSSTTSNRKREVANKDDCSNQDKGKQIRLTDLANSRDPLKDIYIVDICAMFVSQQKAFMKTSQVTGAEGLSWDVFSCNFCAFTCSSNDEIREHALQVHKSKSLKCFVCTVCNLKFSSKDLADIHVRANHLDFAEEHKCEVCDIVFVSEKKLTEHRQGHTVTRTVSCEVCKATFKTKRLLAEHVSQSHLDSTGLICRVCGDNFSSMKALSDHMLESHKMEKNLSSSGETIACRFCDITFTSKKSWLFHKNKFHPKNWKPYPCHLCDHVSGSRPNLETHLRTHSGEKPFMCEVCGKDFAQSSTLERHIRIHTGQKPYHCRYCDFSCTTSSNRLKHERIHRNERPYVCEQCGKTYQTSTDLKQHIKTHNELRTKQFVCHCGAGFDLKGKLKRHQLSHTGQKPYKCEMCGAGFTRLENLRGHQKSQACQNKALKLQ